MKRFSGRQIHFVGIGGAGMSAYARLCHQLGAAVSGSDRLPSPYTAALEREGVTVRLGQAAANLPPGNGVEVVYSSAVPADNPELVEARERGLKVRSRADLLAELSALKRTVAVAGTHGKTTTAAMVRRVFAAAGLRPGWLIGAQPEPGLPNGEVGEGEWLVVEADESDRSLLALSREVAVLTNVELDHAEQFASLSELEALFCAFLAGARRVALPAGLDLDPLPAHTYRYRAAALRTDPAGTTFCFEGTPVRLSLPGTHYAHDAAAALAAGFLIGVDLERAAAALSSFPGAARRFAFLGYGPHGVAIYDDYAHHPSELRATLETARLRAGKGGRVVVAFQPHLYSRTKRFVREFGRALALADLVLCLEVYPARERAADFPGVGGVLVAAAAAAAAPGKEVLWAPDFEAAQALLKARLGPGDLLVVMGAGDIDRLGRALLCKEGS